jgi:hypothetical protein
VDFTNAQTPAPNPWIRSVGSTLGDEAISVFYGIGTLGAMNPARANTIGEGEAAIEGYTDCLTEVVPWPYDEDEEGIAFDKDNLYGVRTRVWRQTLADGGGDKEWYTAVPRTLPDGYTPVGRCGIGYAYPGDVIGSTPMEGFSWNHRAPNGVLLDTTTDEGLARSIWAPMNLNDKALGVSLDNYLFSYVPWMGGANAWEAYRISALSTSHIGFRGAKLTLTPANNGPSLPCAETFFIGCQDITDDPWTENGPPATITQLATFAVNHTYASVSDPLITVDITLGELVPPADGIPQIFYIWQEPIGSPTGYVTQVVIDGFLGPRTDVPLPWFSSTRNRVAPGGIIQPPP